EARDARRVAHDIPGVVAHHHLDEDVAREDLALDRMALAVLDLDLFLGRNEHLVDLVAHIHRLDAVLEVRLTLFSYPEYVWMTYQRRPVSACGSAVGAVVEGRS